MDGLAEVIAPHPALRAGAADLRPTDLVEQVRSSELVDVVDDAVVSAVVREVSRASGEIAEHPEDHREDVAGRSPVDLEVVIPAYNESGRLPATLAAMVAFLSEQPWTSRVVVVDNGSVDDTAATVLAVTGRACNVATGWCVEAVAIGCSQAGKGAAVHRGLRTSRSRIVGFTDADLSTPLETFLPVMAALQGGAAAAIASRHDACASGGAAVRRLGGTAFRLLSRLDRHRGIDAAPGPRRPRRLHRRRHAASRAVPSRAGAADPRSRADRPHRHLRERLVTSTLIPDTRAPGARSPSPSPGRVTAQLAGCRVLVLNWRDVRHSQAGGAELYAHEISKRWVEAGVHVTWLTALAGNVSGPVVVDLTGVDDATAVTPGDRPVVCSPTVIWQRRRGPRDR